MIAPFSQRAITRSASVALVFLLPAAAVGDDVCGPEPLPAPAKVLAFPGAEGFGANAAGGRGGDVYIVESLADSGPGTLRECAQAQGPRTCVFQVDGTIELRTPIFVRQPFLTIAGQTAPGDGVQLKVASDATRPATPLILQDTHDVVIRHLRLRPGSRANIPGTDALAMERVRDVIVDHSSLMWSTDENLNLHTRAEFVTVQWSIIAEGLWNHSMASLTCSDAADCGNITLYGNILAHHLKRSPDFLLDPSAGHADFVNNVVHNAAREFTEVWPSRGGSKVNMIGNTFLRGPWTSQSATAVYNHVEQGSTNRIYLEDNIVEGIGLVNSGGAGGVVAAPVAPLSVAPSPAQAAYDRALAEAGAWPRDAADARVVDSVIDRTSADNRAPSPKLYNVSQVGGWPTLWPGTPPADDDRDGMADVWEEDHGLNPDDPEDRNGDLDGDGYTNLEEYLNERAVAVLGLLGSSAES